MVYAGFWARLKASLIDCLVIFPVIFGQYYLVSLSKVPGMAIEFLFAFIYLAYPIFFHARFGQTIGKLAARIRLVDQSGAPIFWRQAFLRTSVDAILTVPLAIGSVWALSKLPPDMFGVGENVLLGDAYEAALPPLQRSFELLLFIWMTSEVITVLFNKKRRAIHDFIAGTVVIEVSKG